jgi:hypothetical protein
LKTVGAPPLVVKLALEAADEEAQHVALCVSLCEQLGRSCETPAIPTLPPSPDPHRDVLLQVVAMCCINETVSAVVLRQMLQNTESGPVHDTIRQILRDEVGHSRIGWAYLAHVSRTGSVAGVGPALPHLLSSAVTEELFAPSFADDPDKEAASMGAVPRTQRLALFRAAMDDLVLPGLEQFGVDVEAGQAWLAAPVAHRTPERSSP